MESESKSRVAASDSRLVRIGSIYVVSGWVLLQFADISLEAFETPAWVMQTLLVIILAGLPVTLAAVWLIESARGGAHRKFASFGVIAMALAISVAGYIYFDRNAASEAALEVAEGPSTAIRVSNPVIAVLPFENMSSDVDKEYLADGMTEDVITLLARLPGLEVIARNSTFKYKGTNADIRDVAADLGADYVIEGSIRPIGDRIRVTLQVIEASSGAHLWAQKYDRPLSEIYELQDDVSLGIAAAAGDAVEKTEYRRLSRSRTANLTAWALANQAEMSFNINLAQDEALEKARSAVAADADYALAHAVLARELALRALVFDDPALAEEAIAEARLAAGLAPDDPKVVAYHAIALLWTGHPEEALRVAEELPELSPGYAAGLVYYGDILVHNGRSSEALPYIQKALRLTPYSPALSFYMFVLGEAYIHEGNFSAAEDTFTAANSLYQGQNQGVLRHLAGVKLALGKTEEARAALAASNELGPVALSDQQSLTNRFTSDNGGPHFQKMWRDLEALQ